MKHLMQFELAISENIPMILSFVKRYSCLSPSFFLKSKADIFFQNYLAESLESSLKSNDKELFYLMEDLELRGTISLRTLAWDTSIFGVSMGCIEDFYIKPGKNFKNTGRILLTEIFKKAKEKKLKHLSVKVNTGDIEKTHLLESFGCCHMDTILFYSVECPLKKSFKVNIKPDITITRDTPENTNEITNISKNIFLKYNGRFHSDPLLAKKAPNLYAKWAKNGCNGYADKIYLAKTEKNTIAGYCMWKKNKILDKHTGENIIFVDLIGVNAETRGKGVATMLLKEGAAIYNEGSYIVIPVHINNFPMQKTVSRIGGSVLSANYTFHKTF